MVYAVADRGIGEAAHFWLRTKNDFRHETEIQTTAKRRSAKMMMLGLDTAFGGLPENRKKGNLIYCQNL
jgi:hypothetical protein